MAEFVEYFALLKEMPPRRGCRGAVAAAIERVDLGGKARAKLRTLSGGMLRRVGIAQAIVNEPELLLLDEPTAGLDPEQRVAFRALLRDLGERATVIVSTHLVEDVGAACTEVALMDAGKIVFHGTPDELTARGEGHGAGDAPLERGYSAVLRGRRGHDRAPTPRCGRRAARRVRVPRHAARLLRLELRRNAMPWMLPLIAVLFWFDSYRIGHGHAAAVEPARALDHGQSTPLHRLRGRSWPAWPPGWGRGTAAAALTDLVTGTARPRWAAQLATWAATTSGRWRPTWSSWRVMFGVTAHQAPGAARRGGRSRSAPRPWPRSAPLGFAAGACFPSRFTAPLAAFGAFLALSRRSQIGSASTQRVAR